MAEQFALDEIAGNCRHVDGNERAFLAFAVIMQGARDTISPISPALESVRAWLQ